MQAFNKYLHSVYLLSVAKPKAGFSSHLNTIPEASYGNSRHAPTPKLHTIPSGIKMLPETIKEHASQELLLNHFSPENIAQV